MLSTTVVLWVHIFGAIGWLGAAMAFGMVIGPSLLGMSPPARTEFFAKVLPKYVRYVEGLSLLTIIFGVITAVVVINGNFSLWTLSNNFQILITTGAVLALVAMIDGLAVVVPASRKVSSMSEQLLKTPGPPPPELLASVAKLRMGSMVSMILLILTTIFMVAGVNL